MKRRWTGLLGLTLSVVMAASMLPAGVYAAEPEVIISEESGTATQEESEAITAEETAELVSGDAEASEPEETVSAKPEEPGLETGGEDESGSQETVKEEKAESTEAAVKKESVDTKKNLAEKEAAALPAKTESVKEEAAMSAASAPGRSFETAIPGTFGEELNVVIEDGESIYYAYTPKTDGLYMFCSKGYKNDPLGSLHDADKTIIASDDDGGTDLNFRMECSLKAGKTYYLKASSYGSDAYQIFATKRTLQVPDSDVRIWADYKDKVTLDPQVQSDTAITYEWYRKKTNGEREVLSKDSTYTVIANQIEQIFCDVRDASGDSETIEFRIWPETGFAITDTGETTVSASVGSRVSLSLKATSQTGTITYKWYRDNEDDEENLVAQSANYACVLQNPIERYVCVVSDGIDEDSVRYVITDKTSFATGGSKSNAKTLLLDEPVYLTLTDNETAWFRFTPTYTGEYCIQQKYGWFDLAVYDSEDYCEARDDDTIYVHLTGGESYWIFAGVEDQDGTTTGAIVASLQHRDNHFYADAEGESVFNVSAGTLVEMKVKAESEIEPLTYQWQSYDAEADEYTDILGAEKPTYQIVADYAGDYRCVIADTYDNLECVDFHIGIDNGFWAELEGSWQRYVVSGDRTTLRVNAGCNTGGVTYTWWKYDDNADEYIKRSNSSASLVTEPITDGVEYRLRVRDQYGNEEYFYFTVAPADSLALMYDDYCRIEPGNRATLKVEAVSPDKTTPITYQWYSYDDNADGAYAAIPGATDAQYNLPLIPNLFYYCEVTQGDVTEEAWFRVWVDSGFELGSGDERITGMAGQKVDLTVEAETAQPEMIYRWYQDSVEDDNKLPVSSNIYTAVIAPDVAIATYYCVVSDGYHSETICYEVVNKELLVSTTDKESAAEIREGQMTEVQTPEDERVWLKFTPEVTDYYAIYSEGNWDTYGYLQDANGMQMEENDDGGDSGNFRMEAYLTAGQTYYIIVRPYNEEGDTALFGVVVKALNQVDHVQSISYQPVDSSSFIFLEGDGNQEVDADGNTYCRYWYPYALPQTGDVLTVTREDGSVTEYVYAYVYDEEYQRERFLFTDEDGNVIRDVSVTNDQYENHWKPGADNGFTVTYAGVSTKIPVTIVENTVASFELKRADGKALKLTENTEGYWTDDSNGDAYYYYYMGSLIYQEGNQLILTDKNGNRITYSCQLVSDGGDKYGWKFVGEDGRVLPGKLSYFNSQSTNHWLPGAENTFDLTYGGQKTKVPVVIEESQIREILLRPADAETFSITEESGGSWRPNNDGDDFYYYYESKLLYRPGNRLTVTLKDGSTREYVYRLKYYEQYGYYKYEYLAEDESMLGDLSFESDQYSKPWLKNEKNSFTVIYEGVRFEVPVEVKENPVAKIDFSFGGESNIITEETLGRWTADQYGKKFYRYSLSLLRSDDNVLTVTDQDGNETNYSPKRVYDEINRWYTRVFVSEDGRTISAEELATSDNQYEVHWQPGETYSLTISYSGREVTVPITIVENEVKAIAFKPADAALFEITEHTNGNWTTDSKGEAYYEYRNSALIFKDGNQIVVTWKDGGTTEYTYKNGSFLNEDGERLSGLGVVNTQKTNHWQAGSQYNIEIEYNGRTASVPVTIVKDTGRLAGDINGDGTVNGLDLLCLKKYQAGYVVTINSSNADVTGDGNVDGQDMIRLTRYLAGYGVTLQ